MTTKSNKEFLREMFSENGVGSCKRLVGAISIFVVLCCVIYLCITEGCTDCVEGLLLVIIIAACSLLGVSSITSIWKNGKATNINKEENKEEK